MKLFFLLLIGGMPILAASQDKLIKDDNAQERKVGPFQSIQVSNAFDLYLTQSDNETVVVSADKLKYRDEIITKVENGVLKISFGKDGNRWWKNAGNKKLKAYVSFKTLEKLRVNGASDVYVDGTINATELELRLTGASDFKRGTIVCTNLTVILSGASRAYITGGQATRMDVEANGASDFHGYNLNVDNCRADASGASTINITVNKELTAKASGASGIHYKGEGVITDIKTSGASRISKRG